MKSDNVSPTPYIVYLVRCWPVETGEGVVWRASAENPHNNVRHMFADLPALYRFLEEKTDTVLGLSAQPDIHFDLEGE